MMLSSRVLTTLFIGVLGSAFAGCAAEDGPGGGGKAGNSGSSTAGTTSGGAGFSSSSGNGAAATGGGAGNGGGSSGTIAMSDELVKIDECPGSVPAATVTSLQDPAVTTVAPMRWLYPYELTVFPRGLEAPLLQWDEVSAQSEFVYLHMTSSLFDYKGCLVPTAKGQLQIPEKAWETAGVQSKGGTDPLSIDLVAVAGGKASKLPTRKITFALAQLKNAIYYNTYGSALATAKGVAGGVVMRVTPKQAQPEVFLTATNTVANCIGCHAVSADGSKLVAEEHGNPGLTEAGGGIYDLSSGMLNPPPMVSLKRAGFSGLYPDGSVYLTTGRPSAGPFGGGGTVVTGTFGPEMSKLVDTSNGMDIAGSGAPPYALMPMFSTDGKLVVFNHLTDAGAGGHELAVMSFDRGSNKFSSLKPIYTHPSLFVGWPAFLPDVQSVDDENMNVAGKRVVFALSDVGDYVTQEAPFGAIVHKSDLWWVDVNTGKAAMLSRAAGFEGTTNFMPYGDRDAHRDFFPTVSPVAAGGYFWVFFSSRRQYGNKLVYQNENDNAGKKIWVAAININAEPGTDPSHPAFYLPGQESESGNVRAFAALSPCRVDGESCESGIDCCSGHCLNGVCGVPEVPMCSKLDEKCSTTADCCEGMDLNCIGGFCGLLIPE